MGNFLVVTSRSDAPAEALTMFQRGIEVIRLLKGQTPAEVHEGRIHAATYRRRNGSGAPLAVDAQTGSWLIATGTWFHSDGFSAPQAERLLRRYLATGALQLAEEVEGFFSVVIADGRTGELVIITDPIGSYHCFMRQMGPGVALSGSSLALAGLGGASLDPVGCQEFVRLGVAYEDRTCWQGVRKLGPASIYRVLPDGRIERQRYWDVAGLAKEPRNGTAAVDGFWRVLVKAAERIGQAFGNPVCDLTGGYDSRLWVGAMLSAGVKFSTTVSGAEDSPDVVISRGLAERIGVSHMVLAYDQPLSYADLAEALKLTDGEYDLVEYARIMQIHRRLLGQFDISLNGSFGEVARGYWWELLFPRTGARRALDASRLARARYAAGVHDASMFPTERRLDLVSHFAGMINGINAGLVVLPNTLQMDHAYLMLRMQRWQGRIASSTNQLWPCLSPMLFRSVLEAMLRTAPALRQRSLLVRRALLRFQPLLAEYPLEHGYPAAPASVRNLHRFWPLIEHYGEKAWRKARRIAGLHRAVRRAAHAISWREALWHEDAVRDRLDPRVMRSASLYDRAALSDFIERSRQPTFPFEAQWARVLSLESALRRLEEVGVRAGG